MIKKEILIETINKFDAKFNELDKKLNDSENQTLENLRQYTNMKLVKLTMI